MINRPKPAAACCHLLAAGILSTALVTADGAVESPEAWVESPLAGDSRTQLNQASDLIDQGDVAAGTDLLLQLIDRAGEQLMSSRQTPPVTVHQPLRDVIFQRLLGDDPSWQRALARYRQRVDPMVHTQWQRAWVERDVPKLERLARDYFPSSWTDQVLDGLARLAFESGEMEVARRYWAQIGWFRGDASASPPVSLEPVLVFPDTDLSPAMLQTCWILTWLFEGKRGQAEDELAILTAHYPQARGVLWGVEVDLATTVGGWVEAMSAKKEVNDSPRPWETFAGRHTRNSTFGESVEVEPSVVWSCELFAAPSVDPSVARQLGLPEVAAGDRYEDPCSYFPLARSGRICLPTAHGYDVIDGADGHVVQRAAPFAGVTGTPSGDVLQSGSLARYLGEIDGHLIALMLSGPSRQLTRSPLEAGRSLVVCDLEAEGRVEKLLTGPGDWEFAGPPLIHNGRMWLAVEQPGEITRSGVVCFDLATGTVRWVRPLVAGPVEALLQGHVVVDRLLTRVGDRLFVPTGQGSVACVDAADGQVQWVAVYARQLEGGSNLLDRPWHRLRQPISAVYDEGHLYVAPTDRPDVFALDAADGHLVWRAEVPEGTFDATFLLGVSQGQLIATGRRVWSIDCRSGRLSRLQENPFPWAVDAARTGMGRGLILGDTLLWPARDREDWLIQLDLKNGRPSAPPLSLSRLGAEAGNLTLSGDRLIIAGPTRLAAFPLRQVQPDSANPASHLRAPAGVQ